MCGTPYRSHRISVPFVAPCATTREGDANVTMPRRRAAVTRTENGARRDTVLVRLVIGFSFRRLLKTSSLKAKGIKAKAKTSRNPEQTVSANGCGARFYFP